MNKSNLVVWGFKAFVGLLIGINMALTAAFGFAYLGAAFGGSFVADVAGAAYGVLLFDLAFLAWFYVYLWIAQSGKQRSIAIGLSVASLIGSTMATLQQLAVNATNLLDLSAHHDTIGMVALITTLVMTALHIIGSMAYTYFDPAENERQHAIDETAEVYEAQQDVKRQLRAAKIELVKEQGRIQCDAMQGAVPELARRMNARMGKIVDRMTADHERHLLATLGLTLDGDQFGRLPATAGVVIDQADQTDQADQPDLDWQPIPTAEQQAEQQREYAERNREYARRNGRKADQLDQRPSIGFSLVDLGYTADQPDQPDQVQPDQPDRGEKIQYYPAEQAPEGGPQTLTFGDHEWKMMWVGNDGLAYSRTAHLPSDPGAAWAAVSSQLPPGMNYEKFAELHNRHNDHQRDKLAGNFTQGGK